MQKTLFGRANSIAGAALVALGIFVFYENLDRAAARLNHLPGNIPSKTLGIVPTIILAAARVMQAYAADHQRFLHMFLQQIFVLFCPLLLVMVGGVLSRDSFVENASAFSRKKNG